ncbi:hypothetical protein [Actinoplanes sp. NPDC051851]|uniref:hypothetical protein n=1 Tax=Actinoplanes sp. NPDC051851 TaxID=3154753 RepID=UPI00341F1866
MEAARRDSRFGVRPIITADRVDRRLKRAVRQRCTHDTWFLHVPAGRPLRDAVDRALERSDVAPPTPSYDRLTGGRRSPGEGRRSSRWDRVKRLLEPVTLFWLVVIAAGGTVMGAATEKTWWDDRVWTIGGGLVLAGLAASLGHLLMAAARMIPQVTHPTDDDLARALLADLRRDWRRRTVFRFTDVPRRLPVLLVAAVPGATDPPPLVRAYQRWHPAHPHWLWWILAPIRRPSAVLITDYTSRTAARPRSLSRRTRARLRLTAMNLRRWSAWPLVTGLGCVLILPLTMVGWVLTGFWWISVVLLVPRRARRRAILLFCYGVTALLVTGFVFVDRSLGQPYCLFGTGTDDVDVEHDEWIGSRTCLGGADLGRDIRSAVLGRIAERVSVHRPGPDDNAGLFDVNLIYRENKRVEQSAAGENRGVVTVALVTSLTTSSPTRPVRSTVAEHEGLAGAHAAQVRINADRNQRMPYVRLAIVNSGDLTGGADEAAVQKHLDRMRESLHRLARNERWRLIAAVVTLNSTTYVQDALRESLGRDGVAILSPTMTADGFGDDIRPRDENGVLYSTAPVFFAVNTINDDQVELVTRYAARSPKAGPLVYYYPVDPDHIGPGFDETDLYLDTLSCDVWKRGGYQAAALHGDDVWRLDGSRPDRLCPNATRISVNDPKIGLWPWSRGESAEKLAESACPASDPPGLLFFGGRYTELAAFTQLVQAACTERPEVAVADSATRFLANGELARLVPHHTGVLIASRGPVLTCESLARPDDIPDLGPHDEGRMADFADDVHQVLHRCLGAGDPESDRRLAGGWAVLEYDTVLMIRDALLRIGLDGLRTAPPDDRPGAASTGPDRVRGLLGGTALRDLVMLCLQGRTPSLCADRPFTGAYGTVRLVDGVGRRPVVLLDIDDLATAFAEGAGDPAGRCVPPLDGSRRRCVFHPEPAS